MLPRWIVAAGLLPLGPLYAADFAKEVQPVFEKRCYGCHGSGQQMSGLRLDSADAALKGGYSGPVIIPGKSGQSKLVERVASDKKGFSMPPMGARLTAAEVSAIKDWIDEGAKFPATPAKPVAANPKSGHWSFQPIRKPAEPGVTNRAWVRNPIDSFVLAKLEGENIEPAPEADKATLIRRLSLDLTGLPPAPEEVRAFAADNRSDAYERLVDRLLDSPHYGEKWARHWLDYAHYADSDGYEKDLQRPWAWRYRQWVIEALNRDLPFDRFTIEQLAGDLLPNPTTDQLVATGFLRNTLTNREGGTDRAEARFEQILNRTNTYAVTWLGLTAGCAQCHNHKFDPISQKEYYQLLAFFDHTDERDIDAPLPGQAGPYLRARPEHDRKRAELLAQYDVPRLEAEYWKSLQNAFQNPGKDLEWDFTVTDYRSTVAIRADQILMTDLDKLSRRDRTMVDNFFIGHLGPEIGKDKKTTESFKELRTKLAELDAALPPYAQAQAIFEDAAYPPSHIHLGGDYKTLGLEVTPGTMAVLPPTNEEKPNRLTLARWTVSKENPLTARVAVNRQWQELFGRGLVRTSEDFGTQGDKPSHPELLDWLAWEFMDRGWSMKQINRLMVTSATYRQSSNVRKDLLTKDPENTLLARQSRVRLPAEQVRDSALEASGLLNDAIGGPSVKPPQPAGVAELGYAGSVKWVESKGADKYRRGLYVHYQRTTPHPMLANFDEPDSNTACSRRRRSNSPLQALNLLNDPVFYEAAEALAVRTLREGGADFDHRLDYAYTLVLGRKPSSSERDRLAKYLEQKKANPLLEPSLLLPDGIDRREAAAWVGLSRVLLNLDEFITRE